MIRMAQYGSKHGHGTGKLKAMVEASQVEVAGVFEPDVQRREQLAKEKAFADIHWYGSADQMLGDASIVAVASEGRNHESLDQTEAIVAAGKHVWYDKPAGDNWQQWQRVVAAAKAADLQLQMGYMLRYSEAFDTVTGWARSGFLGEVFNVRAHMSTNIPPEARQIIGRAHKGGIFYDLAGHMLDQVVWILGRPQKVTAFLRSDSGQVAGFADNTLGVFEYEKAMAWVDIAAMEPAPMARRFEVYGTEGSAVITEPFEPGQQIRLCLRQERDGYQKGEQFVRLAGQGRQRLYELELEAFVKVLGGKKAPDRSLDHELLVQETLLRATGDIAT